MSIYNLEYEKQVIAGLLQYPDAYADIGPFISEVDFSRVNKPIYNILSNSIRESGTINSTILIEKLKALNISLPDLDVASYIDSLSLIQINPKALLEISKELKITTVKRDLCGVGERLQEKMRKTVSSTFEEIIQEADQIYNDKINLYTQDQNLVDLCADIDILLDSYNNDPFKELTVPYKTFYKQYGGFRPGNVYCFASRSGQGKSSLLVDLAYKTANIFNTNTKVLYLDTEMQAKEVMPRFLASLSGVPIWEIESGNYRKNPDSFKKIEAAKKMLREKNHNLKYKHVGNIGTDGVISLIKRWYMKECGRGEKALIVYDYLKIVEGDKSGGSIKEYELMGDKMDALKTCAHDLQAPLLTAVQINRSGVNTNRSVNQLVDDESVISISDRIQWFTSYMGIFRRKVPEEIMEDGPEYGTHKLITLKTRFQGQQAAGHQDLVKIVDSDSNRVRYVPNYINFDLTNFDIKERGSLRELANKKVNIQKNDGEEAPTI